MGAYEAHDCNRNGIPDAVDIATGASRDLNLDGRPDACAHPVRPIGPDGQGLQPSSGL